MWGKLSNIIIKHKLVLLLVLGVITMFMAYQARNITMSYELAKIVPPDDPDMIEFAEFKSLFGEDGNILALAIKDSAIYKVENFRRFKYLSEELMTLKGVTQVISLPTMKKMVKNLVHIKKFPSQIPVIN